MFDSISKFCQETWAMREARFVVWATLIVIAILIAVYVAGLFRGLATDERSGPIADLTDFETMREHGQLDDNEYKNLKAAARTRVDQTGMDRTVSGRTGADKNGSDQNDKKS